MKGLRNLFRRHRTVALALIVLALAMKVIVPAGFMPAAQGKAITIVMCDGTGQTMADKIVVEVPGKSDAEKVIKHDGTCPWGGQSHDALSPVDVLLAAALLLWILAQALVPVTRPHLRGIAYLRPPLRGPPALI